MAFDKEKLHKTVEIRREKMSGQERVQEAALAYARWQGLTDEHGIDRPKAKKDMDRLLDELEGDAKAWEQTKELVGVLNDRVLGGLLSYSLQRSQIYLQELTKGLEAAEQGKAQLDAALQRAEDTAPSPKVTRKADEESPDNTRRRR